MKSKAVYLPGVGGLDPLREMVDPLHIV